MYIYRFTWKDILKEPPPLSPPIFTHTSLQGMVPLCHVSASALYDDACKILLVHQMVCTVVYCIIVANCVLTPQAHPSRKVPSVLGCLCMHRELHGALHHWRQGKRRGCFLSPYHLLTTAVPALFASSHWQV